MKQAPDVFRENLKRIMQRDGWTMRALAEVIGSSASGVYRILSGEDGVTLKRAEKIAVAIGEPLSTMLVERPENFPEKSQKVPVGS